eukprot:3200348-Rhodomonas_salina.3
MKELEKFVRDDEGWKRRGGQERDNKLMIVLRNFSTTVQGFTRCTPTPKLQTSYPTVQTRL